MKYEATPATCHLPLATCSIFIHGVERAAHVVSFENYEL